ncbi:homeodomain-interacting protein kinase 1-like [Mugil cephalus]|uniref:homeodomain-interacting protein kinase 1-like n=1 Tax=Mugil cephalus TaxID=48193 RepID=UPI001FB7BC66|nr:homeodomain-interacting protein kinase 1-like [Mugil cephalus]
MANFHLTFPENYCRLNLLGYGSYGYVFKCLKKDTKEIVAVKVLKQNDSLSSFNREVYILQKLKHLDPDKFNIIRSHGWFTFLDRTFLVFEVLDMSLYDYMSKTKRTPLPLHAIKTIIKDMATALGALKDIGLIHTDLKLDNIMLVDHQRQPFRVKLIDFGLTLKTSEYIPHLSLQPLWYRSPEIILDAPFTEAIDIWSLGLVMVELFIGIALFPGRHDYDVLRFIVQLLGELPKTLLERGINTDVYYHKNHKYFLFMNWTLKTPAEFQKETGIRPTDNRRYVCYSLDQLKTSYPLQQFSREAEDRINFVELLKEMLQLDPSNRITPGGILAHPFITTTPSHETVDSELTGDQDATSAETKTASRNTMYSLTDEDEQDLTLASVSNSNILLGVNLTSESITDTDTTVDSGVKSAPSVVPGSYVQTPVCILNHISNSKISAHMSYTDVAKHQKKKGFRGCLSPFLCCVNSSEGSYENP